MLILAGAGTGKTRVITFRIAHMVEQGRRARATSSASRSPTRPRAKCRSASANLLPRSPKSARPTKKAANRPTICTFHSLCVRILRQHIERLGYKRNFVIYDESEQLGAVKKILASISAKGEKTDPGAVLALLSQFKNGGERAAAFGDPNVRALAQHVAKRYESALHACNAVDFDDLILLTLRLFREHPDALEACRAKYRYVMVDEYQDTNAAQFELVHALTREHRNFCVVGDDDQSIYGWRGAEIANLLDLEKHFPEVKVVKLEQNYRSAPPPFSTPPTPSSKTTPAAAANSSGRSKGDGDENPAAHLHQRRGRGARTWSSRSNSRGCAHRDSVAGPRHSVPHQPCSRARWKRRCAQAGVRYHLIGGQSFFDRREIKDFLAYLKMFINPHDDISLLRIANVPARGLSDVTMERLLAASHERNCSVFAAMKNPLVQATFQTKARARASRRSWNSSNARRVQAASHRSRDSARRLCCNPGPDNFLDETGYFAELQAAGKESRERRRPHPQSARTDGHARRWPAPATPPAERLQTFLEDITLDSDREEEKESTATP